MRSKVYRIYLKGCDDTTSSTFTLTSREAELLRKVAEELTRASEYECQPTMAIEREYGE